MMKITIQGSLCDLNKFLKATNNNRYAGAKIKREETERVALEARTVKKEKLDFPVQIDYIWYCKDKRKDKSNIAFAKKFIEDGLTKAGVIPDDGWKYVSGFSDNFELDPKNPRIEVFIT